MVRDRVNMKSTTRKAKKRFLMVPALILVLCFAFRLPRLPPFQLRNSNGLPARKPAVPLESNASTNPMQALVGALRSATAAASRYRNISFTDRDAQTWRRLNPCAAGTELGLRYARRPHAQLLQANPRWDAVLEEYTALHRTCTRSIRNVTEHFLSGATPPACKFLIVELGGVGLGNKVALLTSAMLYAILTQRTLLLNAPSLILSSMCEPFVGSSWVLDRQFPLPARHGWENTVFGRLAGWESPVWKSSTFFTRSVDARKAGEDTAALIRSAVKVEFSDPEVKRFYCNTEQAFLSEVSWLHFTGCLYFLPKLFAIPAFRPALEALFPDPSLTLTYLVRRLLLPKDTVWEQVKHHDKQLFADVSHRVGIQVRFLYGRKVYFKKASKRANDHVKQCITENNLLPKPQSRVPRNLTRVLVTSLHTALSEELLRMYKNQKKTVKVTQLSHLEKQGFRATEDRMALLEILLLSFVDELLVTPLSTFGGLAQAYGGIVPWFVEVKSLKAGSSSSSCVRAQTVDLCYQASHSQYECPHDSSLQGTEIQDSVPYLRRCLPVEESFGMQLVSPE